MLVSFLELLRRAIWNFLRVEKEHINNCANFKSIDQLDLPFIIKDINKDE